MLIANSELKKQLLTFDRMNDRFLILLLAGDKAFSEVETQAVSQFLTSIADRLAFYLSLHSYSQLILIPYGVDVEFPQLDEYVRKLPWQRSTKLAFATY
jgi:hypothetical protein